jgi:hypothetical protein
LIVGLGFCFTIFKCFRERAVLALSLLGPAGALLFATSSSPGKWASFAYRVDLTASVIALVISVSMLMSALRRLNHPFRKTERTTPQILEDYRSDRRC